MTHTLASIDDSGTSAVALCSCGQAWVALDPEAALEAAEKHGAAIDWDYARKTLRRERALNSLGALRGLEGAGLIRSAVERELSTEEIASAASVSTTTVYKYRRLDGDTGQARKEARALHARQLADEGNRVVDIARATGWNRATIARYLRAA